MSQKDTITVSEFVTQIKSVVNTQPQFQNVAIVGELSNFTAHGSGHFYFSIKDEKASIRCVMFRSNSFKVKFRPKDGDKVMVIGSLDVYPQTGVIQIVVRQMNLDGLGDLYIEFERLKKELFEKGFFDESHKKDMPPYPKNIGIITGENTAAHADMKRTVKERWPYADVSYFFSLVQGEYAKDDLIKQVILADEKELDAIIIARGGGSIEDLWPFNELELVITVFNAKTPIISGIGHESDVTLVDYVADYRAATPTAAVVAATPSTLDVNERIRNYKNNMYRSTVTLLNQEKNTLTQIQNTRVFRNPLSLFDTHYMTLDLLNTKLISQTNIFHKTQKHLHSINLNLAQNLNKKVFVNDHTLKNVSSLMIQNIHHRIEKETQYVESIHPDLTNSLENIIKDKKRTLSSLFQKFDYLSPFKTMQRGFGVLTHQDKLVKSIEDINVDDVIQIQLQDGTVDTKVLKKEGEQDE